MEELLDCHLRRVERKCSHIIQERKISIGRTEVFSGLILECGIVLYEDVIKII